MQTHVYREWYKFTQEIEKSKDVVEELSKLYIIIHENVRAMMKKCVLSPAYNPTQQATKYLDFIKTILMRLAERDNDQYLASIDKTTISKYEEQLLSLVEQIQATLLTQNSKASLDIGQLMSIKQDHTEQQHSLKHELKTSNQRRIRSKSGKSTPRQPPTSNKVTAAVQEEYDSLIPESTHATGQIESYHKRYFEQKHSLEEEMKSHLHTKDNLLSFAGKYANGTLNRYFQQRREFADLIFAQDYIDKVVQLSKQDEQGSPAKLSEQAKQSLESGQERLFAEFKIKTKYMKETVKKNILSTLVDVKKELVSQYHLSNVDHSLMQLAKLSQETERGMTVLIQKSAKKKVLLASPLRSASDTKITMPTYHSKSMAMLSEDPRRLKFASKTSRPNIYDGEGWSAAIEKKYSDALARRVTDSLVR